MRLGVFSAAFLAAAVCLGFSQVSRADEVSSQKPGRASYAPAYVLTDSFEDQAFTQKWFTQNVFLEIVPGVFIERHDAGQYINQSGGALTLDSGPVDTAPTLFRVSSTISLSRALFAGQSFHAEVRVAVHPSSTGQFSGGIQIVDGVRAQEQTRGLAIEHRFVGTDSRWDLFDGQSVSNVSPMEYGQFAKIELDYDAQARILTTSLRDAPFEHVSQVYVPFESFELRLMASGALTFAGPSVEGRGVFVFDDLITDLTTGSYHVDFRPLTLKATGTLYDQNPAPKTSPFPELKDAPLSLWFLDQGVFAVYHDDTILPLDGERDIHAVLLNWEGKKVTAYSPWNRAAWDVITQSLGGVSIDGFTPSVLIAHGFGRDYTWNLSRRVVPTTPSCGLHCGQGGCNVPGPGMTGSNSTVNLVNGNLYRYTQVISSSPHDAGPQLHYNGKNGSSVLGQGWSHAGMTAIRLEGGNLVLLTAAGGELRFRPVAASPTGDLEYAVQDGCCVANYLKAVRGLGGIEVWERGGTVWHFAADGGSALGKSNLNGQSWVYEYDPDGRLTRSQDPYSRSYQYTYSPEGLLEKITDPAGGATVFHFEEGRLVKVTDPRGAEEHYAYNAKGLLIQVTDKASYTWSYGYDDEDRAVSITDAAGKSATITYLPDFSAAVVTDRRGQSTAYQYDAAQNVIKSLTDPLARSTTQFYDADGNMTKRIDPAGYVTTQLYDQYHAVTWTTDAAGGVRYSEYNDLGQPTLEIDANGNPTSYNYDAKGNLVAKSDAEGNLVVAAYDSEGNKISETNRAGETTTYEYEAGVVVRSVNGAGEITDYEVDALGRITKVIDGEGYETQVFVDALGHEVAKEFPDGFSVETYRDGAGREIGVSAPSEPNQRVVAMAYDFNGLATQTTTFLGYQSQNFYDEEANQVRELSAARRERTFTYDDAGQNLITMDGDGVQQIATYDVRGNYAKITDANQAETLFEYDGLNRLTLLVIDDSEFTYTHDLNGNLVAESVNGKVTTHVYDALNRRVATTDPMGNTTTFAYDPEGRLTKQTDPLGRSTLFAYDLAGRKVSQTNPDGGTTNWEFNARGLKSAEIDALGHRTEFVYDERGRQVERVDPLGGRWKTEYDDAGRVTAEENPLGERRTMVYDADGRMVQRTDPLGRTTDFEYDEDGNEIGRLEPGTTAGERVLRTKTYNTKNEIVAERAVAGDPATEVQYVRDVAGKIVRYLDERGSHRDYAYNEKGELVMLTDALGNAISFARNADGDVVQKSYSGAGTVSYAYDLNRRLVTKTLAAPEVAESSLFAYDAASQLVQRQAQMSSGVAANLNQNITYGYAYDPAGRQISYVQAGGLPVFYAWDLEGKRTSISVPSTGYWVTTEYDANHRPVRMVDQQSGDVWYFNYDAANRRTSTVYPDGSAIFTTYDAVGQVTEQRALGPNGTVLFLEQNSYDYRGNIVETVTETERRSYQYNARDWLTLTSVENLQTGTFYFQSLAYDPAGNLVRQELRAPNGNTLPFVEVFPSTFDGTPQLRENIVLTYQYDQANRLIAEQGVLAGGKCYQVTYAWDGAGNMIGKTVKDLQGKTIVNTMTWTAENRLVRQTTNQGGVFDNPSFVEGDGKEQNTWAAARTGLNGVFQQYTYDHVMRHVLWEGSGANPSAKYVLGPNRDELLAAYQKSGNALEKSYVYQNFRQDVLAAADLAKQTTQRRNYLPTGVAIAGDQTGVEPTRGPRNGRPLPPQAGANLPSGPLAFGWQGKTKTVNGNYDFANRQIGGRSLSIDPLVEIGRIGNYLIGENNSIRNVDPEGLFTISANCNSHLVYRTIWGS